MSDWFDAESHADRALQMYERGRWAEAEAELRRALSLNPHQPDWQFNLGLTLEAAGRDEEALAAFERAVELMPGQIEPVLAAGSAANRLGRHAEAEAWFLRAQKIDSGSEAVFAGLMDSHLRRGQHEEVQTLHYLAQESLAEPSAQCLAIMGESLFQRQEHGRAAWCLKEALRLEPGMPRLRARLAAIHSASGKQHKAVQLYLRELRDEPGDLDTLLDFGDLLAEMNRLPESAEKYRRVLELDPSNVDAHFRLGETAMRAGRCEQAQLEFELVFKLDQKFPMIRLHLAETMVAQRRLDEARAALREQALELTRDGTEAGTADLDRLGGVLLKVGLPAEAAQVYETAASRPGAATDAGLLRKLALARFRVGDRAGGCAISRRILRMDRACLASMHNLALAAMEEGRLRAAAAWIRRGLATSNRDDGLRRLRLRLWARRIASLLGMYAARGKAQGREAASG